MMRPFSLPQASSRSSQMLATLRQTSFGSNLRNQLFTDIDRAVGADTVPVHEAVLRVLARRIADPDLLDGMSWTGSPSHYTRTLLHAGVGYSVLALVWLPGQMSPVHGHKSWCALGVHQGELVETYLQASPSKTPGPGGLTVTGCRQLAVGAVSGSDAAADCYHRVANLGVVPAISIHVYGASFDRLGSDLNRMWAS